MKTPKRVRTPTPMSQRAFAARMKCDPRAVRVAIRDGRVPRELLTADGKIRDADAAAAAWKANTLSDRVPLTGPTAPSKPIAPDVDEPSLLEVRSRHELAKAQLAEIDLAERRAELVLVAELDVRLTSLFASCKTKLLGIPSRARQADPKLTAPQVALIESLVREALEDLAEGKVEAEVDAA